MTPEQIAALKTPRQLKLLFPKGGFVTISDPGVARDLGVSTDDLCEIIAPDPEADPDTWVAYTHPPLLCLLLPTGRKTLIGLANIEPTLTRRRVP